MRVCGELLRKFRNADVTWIHQSPYPLPFLKYTLVLTYEILILDSVHDNTVIKKELSSRGVKFVYAPAVRPLSLRSHHLFTRRWMIQ